MVLLCSDYAISWKTEEPCFDSRQGYTCSLSLLRSTYIGTRAEVDLYSYLMMKLRMRGAVPSLPSYAFVACTGTA